MSEQELRGEVEALRKELAELKAAVAALTAPKPAPAAAKPKVAEVSPDIMHVLAAAVAAFLGKKARIRSVRQVPSAVDGWRMQGRVAIMGSHNPRG